MEKLLAVDGMNLLFQMFYGMPARILSKQSKPIQGTLGFVGALLKLLRWEMPTHAVVLFDGECENPRRAMDEAYKANRPDLSQLPEEQTPFSQLPDLYAALDLLGIAHTESDGCEADDLLAAYAGSCREERQMVIVSQDSDLFQLIGDRVQILRYRGEKSILCDRQWLQQRLGIRPEQYAAFKALTGDPSDNIPGVRGVGPKTAAQLLASFGDLESLLQASQRIERKAVREEVQASIPRIRTNYRLIALQGRQPLPFTWEQLRCPDCRAITTTQVLRALELR